MDATGHLKTIKNVLLFFMVIAIVIIIKTLSGLLIPLAFALFIGILLQPLIAYFERKKWPYTVSISLITLITLGFIFLVGVIVVDTGSQIVAERDKLLAQIEVRLDGIFLQMAHLPGFSSLEAESITDVFRKVFSPEFMLSTSGAVAGQLGTFTFNFILSAVYLVAVLGSIVRYEKYINYLEGDDTESAQKLLKAFVEVKNSIVSYMKVKFFTSLCTGIFFGGISWIFGIDFAMFWGFLAFILNFIPTVGSITATIPPILLGLIQIESSGSYAFFIGLLILTQFAWGNIIEPYLMGSSVALNTVTVILGLIVWGYIWGVSGMLLSVPLIVMARVILAQMPDADLIVKLMGRSQLGKQKVANS